MLGKTLLTVLVCLMLSGCSNAKNPTDSESTSSTGSTATSHTETQTSTISPIEPLPLELRFTDCKGVAVGHLWPGSSAPAGPEVPPGWEQDQELLWTDHHIDVMECQRISIDKFERGPVHFVLEAHDKMVIPQPCLDFKPEYNDFRVLRSFWLDDPEIVQYLAEELGMPALFGEFGFTETPSGAAQVLTWTWGLPGQPRSEIDYARVETVPGGSPSIARLVWHNGNAVSLLDFHEDEYRPAIGPPVAHTRLRPPMMHAVPEVEVYPGPDSIVDVGAYDGPIHRFGDLECETPLQ